MARLRRTWVCTLAVLSASPALCQTGRVLAAGYSTPSPIRVAPGQVITLFVQSGATQPTQGMAATNLPLPTTLNGYSVRFQQSLGADPVNLPLFAVYPVDTCYGQICDDLTAITVQIPWELVPNLPRPGRPSNFVSLQVFRNGVAGEAFPVSPESDSIHVVTTCDSTTLPNVGADPSTPCRAAVTHADGSLVTPANPAKAGETLVVYAFGLGETNTVVRTGAATREPGLVSDVAVYFQFGPNLAPVKPAVAGPVPGPSTSALVAPVFAGLTPGQVGLYQISFVVPALPANSTGCTGSSIASNITVSIGRSRSFDGAGICVE